MKDQLIKELQDMLGRENKITPEDYEDIIAIVSSNDDFIFSLQQAFLYSTDTPNLQAYIINNSDFLIVFDYDVNVDELTIDELADKLLALDSTARSLIN